MKVSQNNYQEVEKLLEKKKRDNEGGYWYIKSEDIEATLDRIFMNLIKEISKYSIYEQRCKIKMQDYDEERVLDFALREMKLKFDFGIYMSPDGSESEALFIYD